MGAVNRRITYKYKARFLPYVWVSVFLPLSIALGIEWTKENGILNGLLFSAVAVGFVMVMAYLLLSALSDVEADDEGIARRAIWWRWQCLRWSDVVKLTIAPSVNPATGEKVRALALTGRPIGSAILTRSILFQERLPAMRPLLDEIDRQVHARQILVQDLTGGATRDRR